MVGSRKWCQSTFLFDFFYRFCRALGGIRQTDITIRICRLCNSIVGFKSVYCILFLTLVVFFEGRLVLNISKNIYEQLGLEGQPSSFCRKQRHRYVVTLDLLETSFRPPNNIYKRVEWCFSNRLGLAANVLISWVPFGKFKLTTVLCWCILLGTILMRSRAQLYWSYSASACNWCWSCIKPWLNY